MVKMNPFSLAGLGARTPKSGARGVPGGQGGAEGPAAARPAAGADGKAGPGKAQGPAPAEAGTVKPHKPGEPSPQSLQGDAPPRPDGHPQTAQGNKWDKLNAFASIAMMGPMLFPPGGGGGHDSAEAKKAKHEQEKADKEHRYLEGLGAAEQAKHTSITTMIHNI